MSGPLASVVIPTFNRARLLPRAIESVLEQTLRDIEVIVVDDGSTDRTAEVVDSFPDGRVEFVSHEQNRGGSAARNTGIERATGRYVAFLDDDDEYLPEYLETQVSRLESLEEEWIAAYSDYEFIEQGLSKYIRRPVLRYLNLREKAEGGEELIPEILLSNLDYGGASTLVVEREWVEAIDGFDESFRRYQDREFLIRLLRQGRLAYTDQVLVRRYDTGEPAPSVCEDAKKMYMAKFDDEILNLEDQGHEVAGVHQFDIARRYIKNGQFAKGAKYLPESEIQLLGLGWAVLEGMVSLGSEQDRGAELHDR